MRYLTTAAVVVVASWLVFLLVVNLGSLGQAMVINLGVPFWPLGQLAMPLWVGLLFTFAGAFLFALVLETVAWYEYSRMIRLQRKQIRGLQDALTQARSSSVSKTTT